MENQRKNQDKKLRSGERQVRSKIHEIEWNHKWRYCMALSYIKQENKVLDVGIGCGYGSYILSFLAKQVIGVDDSIEAINYANKVWKQPNIEFINQNALEVIGQFDVICAFEVIEHLKDDALLFQKFKELNPKYIILSTPHISVPVSKSRWHHRHYSFEMIKNLFDSINYETIINKEVQFKSKAIFAVGRKR